MVPMQRQIFSQRAVFNFVQPHNSHQPHWPVHDTFWRCFRTNSYQTCLEESADWTHLVQFILRDYCHYTAWHFQNTYSCSCDNLCFRCSLNLTIHQSNLDIMFSTDTAVVSFTWQRFIATQPHQSHPFQLGFPPLSHLLQRFRKANAFLFVSLHLTTSRGCSGTVWTPEDPQQLQSSLR